jgi:hypothetical protein
VTLAIGFEPALPGLVALSNSMLDGAPIAMAPTDVNGVALVRYGAAPAVGVTEPVGFGEFLLALQQPEPFSRSSDCRPVPKGSPTIPVR